MADIGLPPLDKLDPELAWQAWQPTQDEWNRKWAAHLYRRAGFGATPAELTTAMKQGYKITLETLLNGQSYADRRLPFLQRQGDVIAKNYNPRPNVFEGPAEPTEIRGWWLYCMLYSGHPLREKLTLFWHNHFATSIAKITRAQPMIEQNQLIREHALGKFGPFLLAMSKDPAMLIWLDSNDNIKGHPNENFAREVMELFSLGVGNYTEKDIQEAARAFTGWHTDGTKFEFNAPLHDKGKKTVLGKTGNWGGDDILDILLEQPIAARYLVGKLYEHFVSEAATPPDSLIEPLADSFRKSDYDIAKLMRTMLSSRLFFSDHAYRQRIKSPVELVVGAARSVASETIPPQALVRPIDRMGQMLFAPPNVKGWPGSKAWLNTATLLARQEFAYQLAMGNLWGNARFGDTRFVKPAPTPVEEGPTERPPLDKFDPARLVREAKAKAPTDVVRVLLETFLPGGIVESKQQELIAYVGEGNPSGADLDRRVRETVLAILSMPEYQMA